MTTKELLEVLGRTKTAQRLEAARNPPPLVLLPLDLPPINWIERSMKKNQVLKKYMKILMYCFLSCIIFIALPLILADISYGKSVVLALPPIVFIAASWIIGAWWAWDKDFSVFVSATLGGIPIRIGIGALWMLFVLNIPDVDGIVLIMSMMAFWIIFTVIEVSMIIDFGNRFPRDARQIEEFSK